MSSLHRDRVTAGRILELDGLRGIAILLVVGAHVLNGVGPANRGLTQAFTSGGGFIGVQLFFVLSGYLITSILLAERSRTGGIDLKGFYVRRIRRLYPALIVISAGYLVYVFIFESGVMAAALREAGKALTYTANMYALPNGENFKPPQWNGTDALGHTWSLSVEEQFYILWPLTLALVWKRWGIKGVGTCAIAGTVGVVLLRAFVTYRWPVFNYAVLRWDALLIGCALAIFPIRRLRGGGWIGAAVLAYYFLRLPEELSATDYLIATIACALSLRAALGLRWLGNPVLVWFGTISYSLYLWHVLILRYGPPPVMGLAASVAVAYLSTTFIEMPLRHRRVPDRV